MINNQNKFDDLSNCKYRYLQIKYYLRKYKSFIRTTLLQAQLRCPVLCGMYMGVVSNNILIQGYRKIS